MTVPNSLVLENTDFLNDDLIMQGKICICRQGSQLIHHHIAAKKGAML